METHLLNKSYPIQYVYKFNSEEINLLLAISAGVMPNQVKMLDNAPATKIMVKIIGAIFLLLIFCAKDKNTLIIMLLLQSKIYLF